MLRNTQRFLKSSNKSVRTVFSSANVALPHTEFDTAEPKAASVAKGVALNSVKIASVDNSSPLVNFQVSFMGGSAAETYEQKGSAVTLASTAFLGNSQKHGIVICREFEDLGARIGCSFDREKITYDLTVERNLFRPAFELLTETFNAAPLNYQIDENKFNASVQHYNMSAKPALQLKELIFEAAYGEESPLGGSMYSSDIMGLSGDTVLEYRNATFKQGNVVVTARGVDVNTLNEVVTENLVGLPSGKTDIGASTFIGGFARDRFDFGGFSAVSVGFVADPSKSHLNDVIFQHIKTIAKKMGVDGSVSPFYYPCLTGGVFGINAIGSVDDVNGAIVKFAAAMKQSTNFESAKASATVENFEGFSSDRLFQFAHNAYDLNNLDARKYSGEQLSGAFSSAVKTPCFAQMGRTHGVLSHDAVKALFA